jgi:hypothetical protein
MHENLNTNPVVKRFMHSHVSKYNSLLFYTGVLNLPPVKMELETHASCILTDTSPQFIYVVLINSTYERMTKEKVCSTVFRLLGVVAQSYANRV